MKLKVDVDKFMSPLFDLAAADVTDLVRRIVDDTSPVAPVEVAAFSSAM